jgi:histidinol dehydrogenase
VQTQAQAIVEAVHKRGGEAVVEYTRRFDRLELDAATLQSSHVQLDALAALCPTEVREAIDVAHTRIEAYHRAIRPSDGSFDAGKGVRLAWRWTAVDAVGVYVPGGRASYPSSALMNIVPAKVAGVSRIVMVAPAPDGKLNPAVAYAALRAGVQEFYPMGGAQAVAALAYGAGPLKPVDKIVGPGNAYVAAAKRIVFGKVGLDTIAGPSEITVVADGSVSPDWVAADLLSQAEHDPAAQSILISDDPSFIDAVLAEVERLVATLSTASVARASLASHGAAVEVASLQADAASLVDLIAPEHVQIMTRCDEALVQKIRHAGAVFVGPYATEALGDYVTGSNHVLPTYGAARFASGLSTMDFMKRTSVQRVSADGFRSIAGAAHTLAETEGLAAHALAVSLRQRALSDL